MNDWEIEPEGPFNFMHGIVDPFGGHHVLRREYDLPLDEAIALFARTIYSELGTWSGVLAADGTRVIARIRYLNGVIHWGGCKAAFDQLASLEPAEDVFWWAAMAQNLNSQEQA